jgi:hypothetical protein
MMNEKELGVLLGTIYTDFLVFESTNLLCNFFMYGWSKQLVQVAVSAITTAAAGPYVTSARAQLPQAFVQPDGTC